MTTAKPNADRIAFLLNQRKGLLEDLRLTPLGPAHSALAAEVEQINHSLWLAGYEFGGQPAAQALRASLYGED